VQRAQAEAKERADFDFAVATPWPKPGTPEAPQAQGPTNARNFKAATPGALIVCPTRELAQQVAHDAIDLVKHCRGLRVANIVGGMPYQLQIAKLQNADLCGGHAPAVCSTCSARCRSSSTRCSSWWWNEADRMLDLGFSDDLAEINQLTSQRRQTMMFSATFARASSNWPCA